MLFSFSYKKNVFDAVITRFPNYKILISKGIINELGRFSQSSGKKRAAAKVALLEIKAKKINVDNIFTYPDKWILDTAKKYRDCVVITNDTALVKKLFGIGVKAFKISKSGILKIYHV
jgi:rRNA-processing protein FCF1